jgi:hypothetical protein
MDMTCSTNGVEEECLQFIDEKVRKKKFRLLVTTVMNHRDPYKASEDELSLLDAKLSPKTPTGSSDTRQTCVNTGDIQVNYAHYGCNYVAGTVEELAALAQCCEI